VDHHIILGIHVIDRIERAGDVQEVLSEFGCNIKTRIGLHDVANAECAPSGVILLEMFGTEDLVEECEQALAAIEGVDVKKMVFEHSA